MKVYIYQFVDSKFTNQETGEVIEYSHALARDGQHQNTPEYKGNSLNKLRTVKGLINKIDANNVPGFFECDFEPAAGGRIRLTSAKAVTP